MNPILRRMIADGVRRTQAEALSRFEEADHEDSPVDAEWEAALGELVGRFFTRDGPSEPLRECTPEELASLFNDSPAPVDPPR